VRAIYRLSVGCLPANKSFEERSLKMRTITNIKNKNTGLFSFSLMAHQAAISLLGQFRASQGQQGSDTYMYRYMDGRGPSNE
jgi:hypothetical protein